MFLERFETSQTFCLAVKNDFNHENDQIGPLAKGFGHLNNQTIMYKCVSGIDYSRIVTKGGVYCIDQ